MDGMGRGRREGETGQEGGEHARCGKRAGESQNLRSRGTSALDFALVGRRADSSGPRASLGERAGRV